MKSKLWFLASLLMLILGITCIAWRWHGTANVSLAIPMSAASVQFCGSASGGLAIAGLAAVILAVLLFLVATFRWMFSGSGKPPAHAAPNVPGKG
jgi:hypothetical protein